MKKENKERRLKHMQTLKLQRLLKEHDKIQEEKNNLFDYLYQKKTDKLRSSSGLVQHLWQFVKME